MLVGVDQDLQLRDPGRPRGRVRTFGRACLRVRADCQNTASRPRAVVNTSWDRFSRARSRPDRSPHPGADTNARDLFDDRRIGRPLVGPTG